MPDWTYPFSNNLFFFFLCSQIYFRCYGKTMKRLIRNHNVMLYRFHLFSKNNKLALR